MATFAHIARCAEIGDEHFASAAADRASFGNLVGRLAHLATPGNGAVKLLLACARVVRDKSPWIEGFLRVKLVARGDTTKLEVMSEEEGVVEPLFPPFFVNVPLTEFSTIADKTPHLLAPLLVVWSAPTKLTLTGDSVKEGTTAGPLSVRDEPKR